MPQLLSIVEVGGYADFTSLYQQAGFQVEKATTMRKALGLLKKQFPKVIVAEFNFAPKYGSFISNVDSLMALIVGKSPSTRLVLFVHKEEHHHLQRLCQRFPTLQLTTFTYPIQVDALQQTLTS
ncbi:hypothetical protein [Candidatus Albibeggiatoa sp. nov. NOAA]|uniref:hypothetical protein n=1 Tax=Candidatus Albibeggiatoa sp. nov. NOAA TaxID=3162724 RepID=UPI0032FD094B|nr:hypothetical protein [Thiotrichaceae bacterium]